MKSGEMKRRSGSAFPQASGCPEESATNCATSPSFFHRLPVPKADGTAYVPSKTGSRLKVTPYRLRGRLFPIGAKIGGVGVN